jgi:lysophospholipase L1-like esterase
VTPRYERYVALGDSSTEGLMDRDGAPGGAGSGGYVGWSRRLAQRIADHQGGLLYANLGRRGLTTREIREQQLGAALAMRPDLASVFSGTNDVLRRNFDVAAFAADVRAMQEALRAAGATAVTFNLPDLSPLLPWARPLAPRIRAMNVALREVCESTGTRLVDFAAHRVATDPRLWDPDRIHANPAGHARIADALAHALELPGSDATWADALPEAPRAGALAVFAREAGWAARYLVPWTLGQFVPPTAAPTSAAPELLRVEPSLLLRAR